MMFSSPRYLATVRRARMMPFSLSDQEVVKMLKVKGIILARRTVAKYRGELHIMPSNLRKQY